VSDAGVVDPIRVPDSVQSFVRGAPRIALVFIALAILDVVGRWLGALPQGLYLSIDHPESFLTAFLPHDALILLPAAIVLRRPDAETATPLVFRGAVLVALVELLGSPTRAYVSDVVSPADLTLLFWVADLGLVLYALGWLAVGRGLSTLNPATPPATVAGLANLAALLIGVTIVFGLIGIAFSTTNIANETGSGPSAINKVAGWFEVLAWAYLVRSVLRGLDDPSRSLTVTRLAAVGALLSASMTFFIAVLGLVAQLNIQIALQIGTVPGILAYVAGDSIGIGLIILAIALGFADPLRPMPKDWDKAATA
jgi:hypothetical protein